MGLLVNFSHVKYVTLWSLGPYLPAGLMYQPVLAPAYDPGNGWSRSATQRWCQLQSTNGQRLPVLVAAAESYQDTGR